jgi:hypothetical protein
MGADSKGAEKAVTMLPRRPSDQTSDKRFTPIAEMFGMGRSLLGPTPPIAPIKAPRSTHGGDRLIGYTENGYISPDNNMVENDIGRFAVGRRNRLFAGYPNGRPRCGYSILPGCNGQGLRV